MNTTQTQYMITEADLPTGHPTIRLHQPVYPSRGEYQASGTAWTLVSTTIAPVGSGDTRMVWTWARPVVDSETTGKAELVPLEEKP